MIRSFLDEIAEKVLTDYGQDAGNVTIVFPNKRAGLFFTRALSQKIIKPIWSPRTLSIEEFIFSLTGKKPADRLTLLLDLYNAYKKTTGFDESFDRFYFWGELLLNDFDEIDKYLVDPAAVFSAVRDLKDIDAQFPFLTDEEKEIISGFWGNISGIRSGFKEGFLRFWHSLPAIYKSFSLTLDKEGYSTPGKIFREIAGSILDEKFSWKGGPVIFAGFNALTASEEEILKWFVNFNKGIVIWDTDAFYVDDPVHEAGIFHRKYLKDKTLGNTFPKALPSNITGIERKMEVIAASSASAQVQWIGKKLSELSAEGLLDTPERSVIVLPEESMVASVLFAIPESLQKLNITIAYPVKTTPMFSFFELLTDLHVNKKSSAKETWFSHLQVIPLLSHPVVMEAMPAEALDLATRIRKMNKILVPSRMLDAGGILSEIFKPAGENENVMDYLAGLVLKFKDPGNSFDEEIRYYFFRLFSRIRDVFDKKDIPVTFQLLKKVLRQMARAERVSFSGEPLEGLQVMGILETRNLDFENVIIIDMNEGSFPRQTSHNSFIPYNVRRVFRLPNFEHNSSMFAYHFYRLLQRSKKVWLVYNSEETGLNTGEPSRFIRQLKYESGLEIKWNVLVQKLRVAPALPVEIAKNPDIMERLTGFTVQAQGIEKHLTPSALNTYLDCPVTFYYKYIMGVKEIEEVKPEFDALLFGNILHKAMEELYLPVISDHKGLVTVDRIRELRKDIARATARSFSIYFGMEMTDDFKFEGRNLLGRGIVEKLVSRILSVDEKYAPFRIMDLERRIEEKFPVDPGGISRHINIKGIIDRIDEKDGMARIVDYKSGKDRRQFESVDALFGDNEKKRNKAVFQLLFYTMILEDHGGNSGIPAMYNANEIYRENFNPLIHIGKGAGAYVPDMSLMRTEILPQFKSRVHELIHEIFNPEIPFRHRDTEIPCKFCKRAGFPS